MAQAEPLAIEFEALKTVVDEVRQGRRGAAADALLARVGMAYGPAGMGVLLVHGVPQYARLRQDLLPYSSRLAQLPEEEKAAIVVGAAPTIMQRSRNRLRCLQGLQGGRRQGGCKEAGKLQEGCKGARRLQGGREAQEGLQACVGGWWG